MEVGGFIGAYRLEQPIGEGGMGAVWKARHPTLDRPVALKLIRSEVKASPQAREAFLREVRVLSRLHGPQILHVTDFGFTETGDPYMVTEFLEGEDLLARVRRAGPLGAIEAIDIGVEVLEALAEAHAVGLVHRDLKPGNVFLQKIAGGARTAVKVLDFGVAKLLEGDDEDTLWPGARLKGSPRYMAPEQITGGLITPATDIYAFGAMMYRVLTGKPLFGGDRDTVLRSHISVPPPPMNRRAKGLAVPDELEDIVFGCLEKSPDERPGSADALQVRMKRLGQRLRAEAEGGEISGGGLALDWSGSDLSADAGGDLGHRSSGSLPGLPSEPGGRGGPGLDAWFQSTGELPVPPSDPPAAAPAEPAEAQPEPSDPPESSETPALDRAAALDGWGIDPPAGAAETSETGPALELDRRPRPATVASMAGVKVPEGGIVLDKGADDGGLELAFDPASRGGRSTSRDEPRMADPPPAVEDGPRAVPVPDVDPAPEIADRPDGYRPAPSIRIARVDATPWHVEHRVPLIAGAAVVGLLLLVWIGRAALVGGMGVEPETAVQPADAAVAAEPRRLDLGVVPRALDRGLAVLEAPAVARGPASADGAPTAEQRPTVLIRPDPPPATFTRADTGEVICEDAATCRAPIDVDVIVTRKGYRALRLRGDDLYDRRGSSWRVILRR